MTPAGRTTIEGNVVWLPGTGGITYNTKIGDNCNQWAADHLEPGVSMRHKEADHNHALQILACVGNEAIVRSGDAKGEKGFITGKHGGCDHVLVYFPQETLEKMDIDDKIQVRATGQGMQLCGYPDITVRNTPALLEKMNIIEEAGKLKIGVAKIAPAKVMGSGLGSVCTASGDYDICLFDEETVKEYGLDELRFGDIVAIKDADNRFGRSWRAQACTIGVVVHGDCVISGHGPGVATLITAKLPLIEPFIDPGANLAAYFL
jgi:hypothetical protein